MDERQELTCSHCGQVIETDDYSFVHAGSGGTVPLDFLSEVCYTISR